MANSTQAAGIAIFLVAFVLLAGALAAGGSWLLILAAVTGLAISSGIFLKVKPQEFRD